MNVTNQFEQVRVLFAKDGFVAVLEKMPVPPVAQIKGDRIAGQKPAHQSRDGGSSGSQKEMKVIREESPGVAGGLCPLEIGGEPLEEIVTIVIIEKYLAPVNPSSDDVVKGSRDIDS